MIQKNERLGGDCRPAEPQTTPKPCQETKMTEPTHTTLAAVASIPLDQRSPLARALHVLHDVALAVSQQAQFKRFDAETGGRVLNESGEIIDDVVLMLGHLTDAIDDLEGGIPY